MPNDFDEPIVSWNDEMRDENAHKKRERRTARQDDAALEGEDRDLFTPDYITELEGVQWKKIILIR